MQTIEKITSKSLSQTAVVEKNFRSLEEIERVLDTIRQTVEDSTELLRVLEARFDKVATAAEFEFRINLKQQKDNEPGKKSPAPSSNKFKKIVVPCFKRSKILFRCSCPH